MAGACDGQQLGLGGDHFEGLFDFSDGAEGIARALDEERGSAQVGEMLGALLLGVARGMQRIREQEQGGDEVWGRF